MIIESLDLTVHRSRFHLSLRGSVAAGIEDDLKVSECSPDDVMLPDSGQRATTPYEVAREETRNEVGSNLRRIDLPSRGPEREVNCSLLVEADRC